MPPPTNGQNGHDANNDPAARSAHDDAGNVVPMTPPPSKKRQGVTAPHTPPMINMPPATKYMLGVLIGVHLLVAVFLSADQAGQNYMTFGFIPERFLENPASPLVLLSLFTHMLLHGSWVHLAMNGFMLAAFGSGIERWLGSKRMILLFVTCGLCGAGFHYLLNTSSPVPMIGASGAISGLFAAAIIMMARGHQEIGGRFGILPFALLWIGISVGFGMLGAPGGGAIAWAAHVGGFLGGFAVIRFMRV